MQLHQRPFQESFWSPSASTDSLPDFKRGIQVLHQKLRQSADENRTIVEFLKRRIAAEQQYAQQLSAMGDALPEFTSVFEGDVGASLKKCFEDVRSESAELGNGHSSRAENLKTTALDPLERLSARYERIIEHARSTMDQTIARFDLIARETLEAEAAYLNKCKVVEHVRSDTANQTSVDLWLLLFLAQHTNETVSGQTIVDWICANQPPAQITGPDKVAQDLLDNGLILCVKNLDNFSLLNEYSVHAGVYQQESKYQQNGNGLSGLWGRWSQKHQNMDPQIVSKEITEADMAYRDLVKRADMMRMQTEEALFMHYEEMESLELDRIQTIKQAFISIAAALSNTIPLCQVVYDRIMLSQETLNPEKDVLFIVEQYRTGRFCPRPIIYKNFFFGAASDQLFGVSLDDISQSHKCMVPALITKGLAVIDSGLSRLYDEEKGKIWTTHLPLDRVHEAREEMNSIANTLTEESLARYDLLLLASLIRLYLLELPECLLTFEFYEPVKIISASQKESRLASISKLLSTLPPANFHTLVALVSHFHRLWKSLSEASGTALIQCLADTFGPILLRPQTETTLTMHHRHSHRLMRDLVEYCDDVFTDDTHRAQEAHANRRAIVAADNNPKEPSLEAPSFSSTISSSSSPVSLPLTSPPATGDSTSFLPSTQPITTSLTSSTVQRRSSLLSFIRRNPSTSRPSSPDISDSDTIARRSAKAPIPMPSSSTLFEDPDETATPVKPTIRHPHTRQGSSNDDISSLDSFFYDDDL